MPWSEDSKGTFRSSSQAATCNGGGFTLSFLMLKSSKKAVITNSYSIWFDSTWNRAQVYRFSSRYYIQSTTDRFNIVKKFFLFAHNPNKNYTS